MYHSFCVISVAERGNEDYVIPNNSLQSWYSFVYRNLIMYHVERDVVIM